MCDDVAARETAARALRDAGCETLEAATGHDGLRLALAQRPNLALIDARLPDADGSGLCRRIKAEPDLADLGVIVCGEEAAHDGRSAAFDAGADEYLAQPIPLAELVVRVRAMLRLRAAYAEARVRARQQAAAAEFGRRALTTEGVPVLLKEACRLVHETLQTQAVAYWESSGEDGAYLVRHSCGWERGEFVAPDRGGEPGSGNWLSLALSDPAGQRLDDVPESLVRARPRARAADAGPPRAVRMASCVVRGQDCAHGVLTAVAGPERRFTPDEAAFLRAMSDLLAGALDRRAAEQVRLDRVTREARMLDRMRTSAAAPATARAFGTLALREAAPALFEEMAGRYAALIEWRLDHRAYRADGARTDGARRIADGLGALRAGPRDVVELHSLALERLSAMNPARAQACVDEGRLLLVEAMGYLVAYYRSRSLDAPQLAGDSSGAAQESE